MKFIFGLCAVFLTLNCAGADQVDGSGRVLSSSSSSTAEFCFVDSQALSPQYGLLRSEGFSCKSREQVVESLNNVGLFVGITSYSCAIAPDPGFTKVAAVGLTGLGYAIQTLGVILKNVPCTDSAFTEERKNLIAEEVCRELALKGIKCAPPLKSSMRGQTVVSLSDWKQGSSWQIGSVLPPKEPNGQQDKSDMTVFKIAHKEFEKVAWRDVYGDEALRIKYTISYEYGGSFMGNGAYIWDVKVIPSLVYVKPPISLDAVKINFVSHDPTNAGGLGHPIAVAKFELGWDLSALDIGEQEKTVFDKFEIHGQSGELRSELIPFKCFGILCED